MAKNFQYKGDLTQTTLPEMLFSIHRFQVPGVIEARRQGILKRIYIKNGYVLHATSTDIEDSLGTYLLRAGRLTTDQYESTMRARREGDRRYGVLLVELGLLAPQEVYHAIRKQVEAIVWSLFYWQEGEIGFRIGDFPDSGVVRILVPMRQVILAGIKRVQNAKPLVARLGRKDTVFTPGFQTEDLIETGLTDDEHALLQQVDGRRTLYELCTGGPLPAPEAAKLLYAFSVMQMIRRAQGQASAAPPAAKSAPEAQPAEPRPIKIRLKTERDRIT